MSIKPGPKRTNEDGTPDKRQRVTPEKQKDHPGLKPHKHKRGEKESKSSSRELLFYLRRNMPVIPDSITAYSWGIPHTFARR